MNPLVTGALALLAGNLFGGGGGSSQPAVLPEQRRLLKLQERRMLQGDPLNQAILRLAFGMLPRSARKNITIPTLPPLE